MLVFKTRVGLFRTVALSDQAMVCHGNAGDKTRQMRVWKESGSHVPAEAQRQSMENNAPEIS